MKVTVRHSLTLPLGAPPRSVAHLLLTPSITAQQRVEHWSIEMPGIDGAATFRDGFGNRAHLVTQVRPEGDLVIVATGRIEMIDKAGILGRIDYEPMPAVFRRATPATTAAPALLADLPQEGGRIGMLHELMARTHLMAGERSQPDQSQSQSQDGGNRPEGLQSQAQGDVQTDGVDAVDAFIGAARALDIPARFVRGYVFDEHEAAVHCWAEAWDDGLGWIGFDPMLSLCPTTAHIRVACGLDADGTPAIRVVPALAGEMSETVEIADQVPST
jgi:transglutaminase-like putative cysteine protease